VPAQFFSPVCMGARRLLWSWLHGTVCFARCAGAPRPTRPSCVPSGEAAWRTREVEKPLPQRAGPIALAPEVVELE